MLLWFWIIFQTGESLNPPLRLVITNQTTQKLGGRINFRVEGVPSGHSVFLEVAKDCNSDLAPDFNEQNGCSGLVYESQTNTSANGVIQDILYLDQADFPGKGQFWMRARLPHQSEGRLAMFGIGLEPCSLYKTVWDTFYRGECKVHLGRLFEPFRNREDWKYREFELVIWNGKNGWEETLHHTRGVSGVAWLDNQHLLVTKITGRERGLFMLDLRNGVLSRQWKGRRAQSPFAWGADQMGFVQLEQDDTGTLYLNGKPRVKLPVVLDQVVVAKPQDQKLLGLFFGEDGKSPTFIEVDMADGSYWEIGFHTLLYQKAMQSPADKKFLVQRFGMDGENQSWFEIQNESQQTVSIVGKKSMQYAMLGCWSPDGTRMVYLRSIPE